MNIVNAGAIVLTLILIVILGYCICTIQSDQYSDEDE